MMIKGKKASLSKKLGCHDCIHCVLTSLLKHFGFPPFWSITLVNMIVTIYYYHLHVYTQ